MEIPITTSTIMFGITVIGVIFSIYLYFHKPQEEMKEHQSLDALATEKDKLLAEKDLGTKATILAQKELETKALVLSEQVKNRNEENDRRFNEMGTRMDRALTLAENHTHTVDIKVDELIKTVGILSGTIIKLSTIIEERNPRK